MVSDWITDKGTVYYRLLYRATEHGSLAVDFHSRCDDRGPTITFIQTHNDFKFGGFTNLSWCSVAEYKSNDSDAFVFSINRKKKFIVTNKAYVIYCNLNNGCTFGAGHDIAIWDDCINRKDNSSFFPHSYGGGVAA